MVAVAVLGEDQEASALGGCAARCDRWVEGSFLAVALALGLFGCCWSRTRAVDCAKGRGWVRLGERAREGGIEEKQ